MHNIPTKVECMFCLHHRSFLNKFACARLDNLYLDTLNMWRKYLAHMKQVYEDHESGQLINTKQARWELDILVVCASSLISLCHRSRRNTACILTWHPTPHVIYYLYKCMLTDRNLTKQYQLNTPSFTENYRKRIAGKTAVCNHSQQIYIYTN